MAKVTIHINDIKSTDGDALQVYMDSVPPIQQNRKMTEAQYLAWMCYEFLQSQMEKRHGGTFEMEHPSEKS